jgi:hypothetical protein
MLKNLDLGSKNMKPEGLKTLARAHLHNKIRFWKGNWVKPFPKYFGGSITKYK